MFVWEKQNDWESHSITITPHLCLVLGTAQASIGMGSVLLGLSGQGAVLSPALHIGGVHREAAPISDLAFVLSSPH